MIQRLLFVVFGWILSISSVFAQNLPDDFFLEKISGNDYAQATGIYFDEIGKTYITEKAGYIYIVDTNGVQLPQPLIDIHEEVGNWRDHGLLGFALDPNFYGNGHYYLLYAVDRHHLLYYGTSQYHPDSLTTFRPSIGRLVRYTADAATDFTTTLPNSRKVLIGETISTGIPINFSSHGVGAVIFGKDGTLLVSTGDGIANKDQDVGGDTLGTYASQALADGIITPDQDVGAYRAQYLGGLNGKILRVDPATGDGLSTNPFYDAQNPRSPQSRIWSLGLRNPYRIALMPNTGSHLATDGDPGVILVGDVGSSFHEELDVVDGPAQNFGWPLWEGHFNHWAFRHYWTPPNQLAPNPLFGINGCTQEYFNFQDLILQVRSSYGNNPFPNSCDNAQSVPSSIQTFIEKPPALSWRNRLLEYPTEAFTHYFDQGGYKQVISIEDEKSTIDGANFDGTCSIGGVFYEGTKYPEEYQGKYFHADFHSWIKAIAFDENHDVTTVDDFLSGMNNISTIAYNPNDESIYFIRYDDGIYKINYGGNAQPVAVIEADTIYGETPLVIQFKGDKSYDVLGDNLTYLWDFGDGETSTEANPSHTFEAPGKDPFPFTVKLTVTDSLGLAGETERIVSLNNTPPVINITSFEDGDLYPTDRNVSLPLIGEATDEESDSDNLTFSWTTHLHHNIHFHSEPEDTRRETYTILEPLGCGAETYYFRVTLKATDEHGLSTSQEKYVYPNCDYDFVEFFNLDVTPFKDSFLLNWETSLEDSVLYFDVEKGADIWNFRPIGRVFPNDANTYQFTDVEASTGVVHFRIKAYRVNQAFDYSQRMSAKYISNTVDVYPNPNRGTINFYFLDSYAQVNVLWFNAQGQEIESHSFDGVRENQVLQYNSQNLSNGVFFYKIIADDVKTGGRLIFLDN